MNFINNEEVLINQIHVKLNYMLLYIKYNKINTYDTYYIKII
jgi:3-phenylpropionate/cinnamic acid dioxygenase small subunit